MSQSRNCEHIKKKVAFVHNKLMPYRIEFFKLLSNKYDVDFYFTHEIETNTHGLRNCIFFGSNNEELINTPKLKLIIPLMLHDYDVIISGSWDTLAEIIEIICCLIISKMRGKSFIIWTESWNYDPNKIMLRRRLAGPIIYIILRNADACIGPGSKTKQLLLHAGVQESKIFMAPNASYLQNNLRAKKSLFMLANSKEIVKILYLSRITPYKGLDVLLKAYSLIEEERDDILLLIGGIGEYIDYCKELSGKLNLKRCYFLGEISEEDKYNIYEKSDIFVLPSRFHKGICEAWGLVLNEAMSLGKPVITTDAVGGAADLVVDGFNGYVVESDNVEELYYAIKNLVQNKNDMILFGERSRDIIRNNFTYKKMLNGFEDAILWATSDNSNDL